jgi:hypothetical protein
MIKVLGKLFKEILEDYDLGDTAPSFLTRSSSAAWIAPLPTFFSLFQQAYCFCAVEEIVLRYLGLPHLDLVVV